MSNICYSNQKDLVLCKTRGMLYFIPKSVVSEIYIPKSTTLDQIAIRLASLQLSEFAVDARDPKNPYVIKNRHTGDVGTKIFIGISKPTNTATFYARMSNTFFQVPFTPKKEFDEPHHMDYNRSID